MHFISTADAPAPAGHYSQGVVHGGTVYVAGQLPLDPSTGAVDAPDDVAQQAERTLRNVEAILHAAGSSLNHVCSMTIYITDRALWPEVNAVYARVLGDHRPARAVIPVPELREGCLIEIQAVAAIA